MRHCWAIVSTFLFLAGISSGCSRWAVRYDGPGTVQEMMAVRYQCFQENVVSHERSNASFLGRVGSYSRSAGGVLFDVRISGVFGGQGLLPKQDRQAGSAIWHYGAL